MGIFASKVPERPDFIRDYVYSLESTCYIFIRDRMIFAYAKE